MSRAFLAVLAAAFVAGCANGDGHGFGTLSGTMRVTFKETDFKTAEGRNATVKKATITVGTLGLEASDQSEGVLETRTASVAINSSFGPLAGDFLLPYGPLEVDAADYDSLTVRVSGFILEGESGADSFVIVVEPKGGVLLRSAAALPVDDERPPNIAVAITVEMGAQLLDGLDPTAEGIAEVVAERAAALSTLKASWSRSDD